jgi:hypothetical protein
VWFIILFPTLIVLLFFITLWAKRESFYSPMEFRDDQSFLTLLTKVDRLEAKQEAAELDPVTADLSEVFATIDRLLTINDVRSAIEVGRAYLTQGQYDESTKVFSYLQEKASRRDEAYSVDRKGSRWIARSSAFLADLAIRQERTAVY